MDVDIDKICENPEVEKDDYSPETKTFYMDNNIKRELEKFMSDMKYENPEQWDRLEKLTNRKKQRIYELIVVTVMREEDSFLENLEELLDELDKKDF